ncbi:MAG: hypothetical protein LDL31_09730 [Prosthecobacter sp.]|jgi:hypothetical protein|nr:hypothetical protein [Prosthecobacter sp.]
MKKLIKKTFVGALYATGMINGCKWMAGKAEVSIAEGDRLLYLLFFLSAILWPFAITYGASEFIERVFSGKCQAK